MTGRPDSETPRPGDDAPTFDAPWQARAFGLAVALTDETEGEGEGEGEERFTWDSFQSRLVAEVEADRESGTDPDVVYYRQWLAALERLLVEEDVLEPGELTERVAEFEAGERDAHEFVDGDPHAHAENLPDGHAEGSHHDHGGGHGHGHDHGHSH
ncbi:nitrile hydratase accessory protein [Halospeciosus flavus]|uniref:Nitrile hydratase accessory protein n=1 Tax=Halospeciosus flavus TaxID=3032283 RepID=A0ABD5Z0V3_9EURY|nr:nitrile hydratase accessory protein [Halospeciosus flavus]